MLAHALHVELRRPLVDDSFTDAVWKTHLSQLADVVGPEAYAHASSPAARLCAAIPYLAGSEDPDRFALSNLLTYHGATKVRAVFNHRPSDDGDTFRRLATLHVGKQADPAVVDYGWTLLTLISLGDHEHDREVDRAVDKYNPLVAGTWDAEALRGALEAKLDENPSLKERYRAVVHRDELRAGESYW
jgi:hypothetical protein